MGRDKYITFILAGYGGKGAKTFQIQKRKLKLVLASTLLFLTGLVGFAMLSFSQNAYLRFKIAQIDKEKRELKDMLSKERQAQNELMALLEQRTDHLTEFKERVKELENKLLSIDEFLRKKGIRKIPKGVGGGSGLLEPDIDYLEFLNTSAEDIFASLRKVPLGFPVFGRITSRYGYRLDPFSKRYEFHKGIDLKAPKGTPVRVTADGKVIFAGWRYGYGKTVIVKHSYGYKTVYAHMSRIKVKKGRWVKAGDVVGYVGSTGKSTGSHLHYEVRKRGKTQNPYTYLYMKAR